MNETKPEPKWDRSKPFPPGNKFGFRHGAHDPDVTEPAAAALARVAREAVPHLAEPSFERAVFGWARVEARCDLFAAYLEREGVLDADGHPRPAVSEAAKHERLAAEARARLGLDPASRAKLERDLADAGLGHARLEAAVAAGRRVRAEREDADAAPREPDARTAVLGFVRANPGAARSRVVVHAAAGNAAAERALADLVAEEAVVEWRDGNARRYRLAGDDG